MHKQVKYKNPLLFIFIIIQFINSILYSVLVSRKKLNRAIESMNKINEGSYLMINLQKYNLKQNMCLCCWGLNKYLLGQDHQKSSDAQSTPYPKFCKAWHCIRKSQLENNKAEVFLILLFLECGGWDLEFIDYNNFSLKMMTWKKQFQ